MIKAANNNLPIQPVIPALVTSTDDTTDYIYEGKGETKKESWKSETEKSLGQKSLWHKIP